jgi:hypothetical protein
LTAEEQMDNHGCVDVQVDPMSLNLEYGLRSDNMMVDNTDFSDAIQKRQDKTQLAVFPKHFTFPGNKNMNHN